VAVPVSRFLKRSIGTYAVAKPLLVTCLVLFITLSPRYTNIDRASQVLAQGVPPSVP
jgi:hypothetical protein